MLRPMPLTVRRVRIFRNGRNQAIRIPREMELEGAEALVHREGDRLIVQSARRGKLLSVLSRLEPLEETFPDVDEGLPAPDDIKLG
jgi:antitoxin VapB